MRNTDPTTRCPGGGPAASGSSPALGPGNDPQDRRLLGPLPELLAEIAAVAGIDAALRVAAAKGGIRAYFPRDPGPEHWLAQAVGLDAARKIGEHLAPRTRGIELEVPLGPTASQAQRWRRIVKLSAEGQSNARVARAVGCHVRTVRRVVGGRCARLEPVLAQGDLFDED